MKTKITFLAVLLALCLMLSVTAAVAEDTLATIVNNAANGATITLNGDVTLTSSLSIKKTITLDLNGHKIDANFTDSYGTIYVGTAGNLTIKDSKGTGSIVNNNGGIVIGNYGTVTILGGTLKTGSNPEKNAALYNFYYNGTTYGKSTISGGTMDGAVWNCGVMNITGGTLNVVDNSGKMSIEGNPNVKGAIIARDGSDAPALSEKGTLVISGGTYAVDVSKWVATGYVCVKNANGTYTVRLPIAAAPAAPSVPQTGDETPIMAAILMMMLSAGAFVLLGKRKHA